MELGERAFNGQFGRRGRRSDRKTLRGFGFHSVSWRLSERNAARRADPAHSVCVGLTIAAGRVRSHPWASLVHALARKNSPSSRGQ